MKSRLGKKGLVILLVSMLMTLMLGAEVTHAASEKQLGKYMQQYLKYYRGKKYKKARAVAKKMPKTYTDPYVKKMSAKMKKAYLKVVRKYYNKSGYLLSDYYLVDIDNDKRVELILDYGGSMADRMFYVYKYSKGKAKKIGKYGSAYSDLYAYPKHNGIVLLDRKMGYESMEIMKIQGGKLVLNNVTKESYRKDTNAVPGMEVKGHYIGLEQYAPYKYRHILSYSDLM